MTQRFPGLTGFVLAGGASSRMGRPKHTLALGGETLLVRAVRVAQSAAGRVMILGPAERARGIAVPALPDDVAGCGPLGALFTGLRHTRTEFNLFLSCDLPFLPPSFLTILATLACESGADATLGALPGGRLQPLAAIYRRRARHAVGVSLDSGRYKMTHFLRRVEVRVFDWREAERAGFRPSIFDNLNTPDDYARACGRFGR